jgi:hypothetical protein
VTATGYIIQEIQVFDELSLCATGKIVSTTQATYYEAWKVTAGTIEANGVDAWHLEPTPNGVTRSARVVGKAKFIATNEPDGWQRGVSPYALSLRSTMRATPGVTLRWTKSSSGRRDSARLSLARSAGIGYGVHGRVVTRLKE